MSQKREKSSLVKQGSLLHEAPNAAAGSPAGSSSHFSDILKPHKTFRIAVSGDVHITRLEKDIIDTRDFQRLRGIRQLGNVSHVYPTALHTRFDHSIGTLAMADRMLKAIRTNAHSEEDEREINESQEILIRLYALLHDVTHISFGHTIEDELGLITRHDSNPERILRFLGPDSVIGKLIIGNLGDELYDRFMSIYIWDDKVAWEERLRKLEEYKHEEFESWSKLERWSALKNIDDAFVHDMVSNTVCADLLDYIARDNYFCNLAGAMEYRFINFLYLRKGEDNKRHVFVRLWKGKKNTPRRDILTDLTRLLEARYLVAERAYFHHAKIISGVMLGRALQEEILAGNLNEEDLYNHTDDTLIQHLAKSNIPATRRLGNALIERRLFKVFKDYKWEDFAAIQAHDHKRSQDEIVNSRFIEPNARRALEDQIAQEIGANPGDILIYAPPRSMNPKAAEMKVEWCGKAMPFKDIDDPIVKPRLKQIIEAHWALWKIYVIGSRELTVEQQQLLRSGCEVHFIDSDEEKGMKYYEDIIEAKLVKENCDIHTKVTTYKAALKVGASDLRVVATDKKQDFSKRLNEIVKDLKGLLVETH